MKHFAFNLSLPSLKQWMPRLAGVGVVAICLTITAHGETPAPANDADSSPMGQAVAMNEVNKPVVADAAPAAPLVLNGLDASGRLSLIVGRPLELHTSRPISKVSIAGAQDVISYVLITDQAVLITPKTAGVTQIQFWDTDNHSQPIDVVIRADLGELREQIKLAVPNSHIEVSSSGGSVVLRGMVPNLDAANQVLALASSYGNVKNFLEIAGGKQVLLQVRFAEVSRQATTELGVNFGFADGRTFTGSNIGQVNPLSSDGNSLIPGSPGAAVAIFGKGLIGQTSLSYFIDSLRQNNLMRILAEPNLVAISGKTASFLAGGSFPVPIPQSGGSGGAVVTVEYKEFGVKLNFTPTVLGDGRVRLHVAPEVSELDFTTAVKFGGFVIPGLTQRKVDTTVELSEGQTFAIAGLLNNSVNATKQVTPVLGDLPIVGALFRSVRYQRRETELVILVTPHMVEATNPAQTPEAPGQTWRHPSENELFVMQDLGGPVAAPHKNPTVDQTPRFYGPYGFNPATGPATTTTSPAAGK